MGRKKSLKEEGALSVVSDAQVNPFYSFVVYAGIVYIHYA